MTILDFRVIQNESGFLIQCKRIVRSPGWMFWRKRERTMWYTVHTLGSKYGTLAYASYDAAVLKIAERIYVENTYPIYHTVTDEDVLRAAAKRAVRPGPKYDGI